MTHEQVKAWVYVLYLSDPERSTYIGFTTWLVRRIRWHQTGYFRRAFTADKRPVIVLAAIPMPNRKAALRLERRLKALRREQKFAFVVGDRALFEFFASVAWPGSGSGKPAARRPAFDRARRSSVRP